MFLLFHIFIMLLQSLGLFVLLITKEILTNKIIFIANLLENWTKSPISKVILNEFDCPFNLDPIRINKLYIDCQIDWDNNMIMVGKNNSNFYQNSLGQNLCVEKLQDFKYFHYKKVKYCKTNEKDCGYLDTLQNKLCLMKNSTCPINRLSLIHHNDKSSSHRNKNQGNIQINKNFSLEVSKN